MNSKERRKVLLRKYTEEVKQLPIVFPDGYDDQGKGSFICPLCLRIFNLAQLGEQVNSFITIEHVPPENLGGKPLVLTCKDCNSTCGHELDVYLRNEMEHLEQNFFNGAKGHYSKWLSREGFEMNGILREDVDGTIDIEIKKKLNSPIIFDKFVEGIKLSNGDLHLDGKIKLGDHRREKDVACVAMLKSAYLYAFYKLGYKYILTTKLDAIRKQILNSEKVIIPQNYLCLNSDNIDSNMQDGLYPATIDGVKVLAVLLTLKLPNSNYLHRFTTILPMLGDRDVDLYDCLDTTHEGKETVKVSFIRNVDIGKLLQDVL